MLLKVAHPVVQNKHSPALVATNGISSLLLKHKYVVYINRQNCFENCTRIFPMGFPHCF